MNLGADAFCEAFVAEVNRRRSRGVLDPKLIAATTAEPLPYPCYIPEMRTVSAQKVRQLAAALHQMDPP